MVIIQMGGENPPKNRGGGGGGSGWTRLDSVGGYAPTLIVQDRKYVHLDQILKCESALR